MTGAARLRRRGNRGGSRVLKTDRAQRALVGTGTALFELTRFLRGARSDTLWCALGVQRARS